MPVWWKTASLNWLKRRRQWAGANCGACWGNTLSIKGANFGHEGFPMGFVAIESPWLVVMHCCCIEWKTLIFYLSMCRRCHTQNKRRCATQAASQAAEQMPTEESQDLRASQAAEVHHWPLNNYCWAISDVLLSLFFLCFLVYWPFLCSDLIGTPLPLSWWLVIQAAIHWNKHRKNDQMIWICACWMGYMPMNLLGSKFQHELQEFLAVRHYTMVGEGWRLS